MASMMLLVTVLNSSVGSIDVLGATGVGLLLDTSEGISRVGIGPGPEGSEKVDLKS